MATRNTTRKPRRSSKAITPAATPARVRQSSDVAAASVEEFHGHQSRQHRNRQELGNALHLGMIQDRFGQRDTGQFQQVAADRRDDDR